MIRGLRLVHSHTTSVHSRGSYAPGPGVPGSALGRPRARQQPRPGHSHRDGPGELQRKCSPWPVRRFGDDRRRVVALRRTREGRAASTSGRSHCPGDPTRRRPCCFRRSPRTHASAQKSCAFVVTSASSNSLKRRPRLSHWEANCSNKSTRTSTPASPLESIFCMRWADWQLDGGISRPEFHVRHALHTSAAGSAPPTGCGGVSPADLVSPQ